MTMLIVADDLTGAADCAAVCTVQGLACFVAMTPQAAATAADVVSIDADTRSMTAEAAAQKVRHIVLTAGDGLLFKKVDSTLRGHVGAELAAALDARRRVTGRRTVALFAPAFPAAGRTTVDGRVLVRGVPLEDTDLWRREGSGPDPSLAGLMTAAGLTPCSIGLDVVRGGTLSSTLARTEEADVIVCDAETDSDLAAIASAYQGRDLIWAGSAGLAGHLARAAGLLPLADPAHASTIAPGPMLFVVGSLAAISREQAAVLVRQAGVLPLPVPASTLIRGVEALRQDGWLDRLDEAFRLGRDVVILPEPDLPDDLRHAKPLREGLAALAAPFAPRIAGLFVTGGETARAVLLASGVTGLRLHGELEPGVPISTASGIRPLAVVTKAGAFGDARTMLNAYGALARHTRPSPPPARNGTAP